MMTVIVNYTIDGVSTCVTFEDVAEGQSALELLASEGIDTPDSYSAEFRKLID
jgi:hypothetical protein